MSRPEECAQSGGRVRDAFRSTGTADDLGAYRMLTVEQAAEFLQLHRETLLRKARSGEIPAGKLGKCWKFILIDLIGYVRSKYPSRVMQGDYLEVKKCRSINAKILPSGGSSYTTAEKSYREALGLPIR